MTSWPYSRSCRTASIRSGRAGGLAGELSQPVWSYWLSFVTASEVDLEAPVADRWGRGSLWSGHASLNVLRRNTGFPSKMPIPNGRRDTFLVDTFAALAARYCMQTVSTHH
jgi:hypothetical protein